MGIERYTAMIQNLLPIGWAWPRQKNTNMELMITALAGEPQRVDKRVQNMLEESYPLTTNELLTDWESAMGLPEECEGLAETVQKRREAVHQKLATLGGQSPQFYIDIAAAIGFTVTITEFRPFVAGDDAGDQVWGDDWAHVFQVNAPEETISYLNAGEGSAGEPLATWGNDVLECVISRHKPAHAAVIFAYES